MLSEARLGNPQGHTTRAETNICTNTPSALPLVPHRTCDRRR